MATLTSTLGEKTQKLLFCSNDYSSLYEMMYQVTIVLYHVCLRSCWREAAANQGSVCHNGFRTVAVQGGLSAL